VKYVIHRQATHLCGIKLDTDYQIDQNNMSTLLPISVNQCRLISLVFRAQLENANFISAVEAFVSSPKFAGNWFFNQ